MGRLARERFAEARTVFDRVDGALGLPISVVCFEGPPERLQETRWQQPAVFACSVACFEAWRATVGRDDVVAVAAGHSLGEYGALVASGAMDLEDAARLVALRGQLMQSAAEAVQGGMCAVQGMDRATVLAICAEASRPMDGLAETVVLANDNAPDQQVISGGMHALERAGELAKGRGARRIIQLKVAGAFHSPLMSAAVAPLADAIERVALRPCAFPVIGNVSASPLDTIDDVRMELIRQVTSPVLWVESVRAAAAWSPDIWVDTGPGKVVAGLASRIAPGRDTVCLSSQIDAEEMS